MPYSLPPEPPPEVYSDRILNDLRRIVQAVRQSAAQCDRASGLTSAQLLILQLIDKNPEMTIKALASATFTHQTSVSQVVTRLQRRGLLSRRKSLEDARRRALCLTDAGRAALSTPIGTIQETLIHALSSLSPARLAALADGLQELVSAAGLTCEVAPMFMEDDAP